MGDKALALSLSLVILTHSSVLRRTVRRTISHARQLRNTMFPRLSTVALLAKEADAFHFDVPPPQVGYFKYVSDNRTEIYSRCGQGYDAYLWMCEIEDPKDTKSNSDR